MWNPMDGLLIQPLLQQETWNVNKYYINDGSRKFALEEETVCNTQFW